MGPHMNSKSLEYASPLTRIRSRKRRKWNGEDDKMRRIWNNKQGSFAVADVLLSLPDFACKVHESSPDFGALKSLPQ